MDRCKMNYIYELEYQTIGYDLRSAKPHREDCIEILQFWSKGGYFIVRNHIFPIAPGTLLIVNAMETHYSNPSNVDSYNRSKIILSFKRFRQICELCDFSALYEELYRKGGCIYPFPPAQKEAQLADAMFQKAFQRFSSGDPDLTVQADIVSYTIRLLSLLHTPPRPASAVVQTDSTIYLMTEYINNQLLSWEHVTPENLCAALHISYSYASHLFKQLTKQSITQYATNLRLAEAKKLLANTDLKIYNIAELLKFKDSTTFCKTFKKHVGCSPEAYRRMNRILD